jgi:hypothetical protein
MSADSVFLARISTVKKFVLVKTVNRIVLIALLCFLGLYTIATILEKAGGFHVRDYISFYLIALAISVVSALGYVYVARESFLTILIDIDTRLHLKDRISTAYEYRTLGKPSEFADLLIEDAGRNLSKLSAQQMLPLKLSLVHLLLGILIVVNISLFLVDRFVPVSKQTKVDRETAKKISTLLQSYTSKKIEDVKKAQPEEQQQLGKKIEELAKKLDKRTMTRRELLKSLNTMLQEVQSTQTSLANDLNSKLLDIKNFKNTPIQTVPQLKQLSLNDLKLFKKTLSDSFGNQIPESLEYDLDQLEEQGNLQELLGQIRDDVGSDQNNGKESHSDGKNTTAPDQQDRENKTENAEQELNSSKFKQDEQQHSDQDTSGSGQNQDTGNSEESAKGRSGSGEESESNSTGLDESESAIGHEKAGDTRQTPYQLERVQGPTVQDKTSSGAKDDYKAHIRALTTIGNATLPEEEVTRAYQQELESILQKEDIPLNYREYIKNYFLSIGLTQPQSTEDTKTEE